MRQYLILLTSFLFFGLTACEKEQLTNEEQHDVLSVTGPTTGSVNTDVVLMVTYPYFNGCDYIERFEETKNGNIVSIKAYSKRIPKNSVCTQDAGTRTIEYKFRSSTTGTYELRFINRDESFVSHTVIIQ